ncbi:MAG TPA: VOC family protein [Acidimicrobiales bacterium]|jgi:catechol 2,3-dioxygenase-like lactoylglutathione lyase family enzyme|nr:VOC family protein [Acidimicrobiales bacterium]
MARLTQLRTMLDARSIPETVAFYERLGFELVNTFGGDPPTWAQVARDGIRLMFNAAEPHVHDDGEVHSHEPSMSGSIYLDADDVDALYDELRPRVERVVMEPTTREHGMREFAVEDPNGYLLIFGAPVAP